MRVTEQIDALETMGVNSASYLILPKIIATLVFNPFLTLISISVGIVGGWIAGTSAGVITSAGLYLRYPVCIYPLLCHLCHNKNTILRFHNYNAFLLFMVIRSRADRSKSARQVQKRWFTAVLLILLFNVILTQLLLS